MIDQVGFIPGMQARTGKYLRINVIYQIKQPEVCKVYDCLSR